VRTNKKPAVADCPYDNSGDSAGRRPPQRTANGPGPPTARPHKTYRRTQGLENKPKIEERERDFVQDCVL